MHSFGETDANILFGAGVPLDAIHAFRVWRCYADLLAGFLQHLAPQPLTNQAFPVRGKRSHLCGMLGLSDEAPKLCARSGIFVFSQPSNSRCYDAKYEAAKFQI